MKKQKEIQFSVYDYDAENVHPGHIMPICWGDEENHFHGGINVNDFIGWMYETGRIDNYHTEGEGLVEVDLDHHEYNLDRHDFICTKRGTFHYTFRQFIRDCVEDRDFETYKKSLS